MTADDSQAVSDGAERAELDDVTHRMADRFTASSKQRHTRKSATASLGSKQSVSPAAVIPQLIAVGAGWLSMRFMRIANAQQKKLKAVEDILQDATKQIEQKDMSLRKAQQDLDTQQQDLAAHKLQLRELQVVQQEQRAAREDELNAARLALAAATDNYLKLKGDLSSTQDQHQQAHQELKQAMQELQRCQGELDNSKGELGLTKSQLLLLRGELDATKRQLRHAHRQLEQAKQEFRQNRAAGYDDTHGDDGEYLY